MSFATLRIQTCASVTPVIGRVVGRQFSRASGGLGWWQKYKEHGEEAFLKYKPPTPFDWSQARGTTHLFFDFTIEEESAGRVEVEVLSELLPETCTNFMKLCTGESAKGFSYKHTPVHRIVKNAAIVLGDVENKDGTGSHSAYETRYFDDEACLLPHTQAGILSMVNGGVHTNGSQFYITTEACPHLDGYSVAFGRVTEGMDVINKIMKTYSIRGRPVAKVNVSDCGVLQK